MGRSDWKPDLAAPTPNQRNRLFAGALTGRQAIAVIVGANVPHVSPSIGGSPPIIAGAVMTAPSLLIHAGFVTGLGVAILTALALA
jgi:hypothetical protein